MEEFVILDLETNGVEPKEDAIIEVAAIKVSDWEIEDEISQIVYTEEEIPPLVTKLTGLTREDVRKGAKPDQIIPEVKKFISDLPIVGHNIDFDISFLKEHGIAKENIGLDTWSLATTLLWDIDHFSLEYLAWKFGFEQDPSHRALPDVKANFELLKLLAHKATNLPDEVQERFQKVLARSNWSWKVLFEADIPKDLAQNLQRKPDPQYTLPQKVFDLGKDLTEKINYISLPHQDTRLEAGIHLAQEQGALMLTNFSQFLDLEPINQEIELTVTGKVNFDRENWLEFLNQKQFSSIETRLALKSLDWVTETNPDTLSDTPYLIRDEVYLWQRKISSRESNLFASKRPLATTYTTWEEDQREESINGPVIITDPLGLTRDLLNVQGFRLSQARLDGSIASRRDFLSVLNDREFDVDSLYKLISRLGEKYTAISDLLVEYYAREMQGPNADSNESELLLTTQINQHPVGSDIQKRVKGILEILNQFTSELKELKVNNDWIEDYRAHQLKRVEKWVEKFQIIKDIDQNYDIYLSVYRSNFELRVLPSNPSLKPANELKQTDKIIMLDNGSSAYVHKRLLDKFGLEGKNIDITPKKPVPIKVTSQNHDELEWKKIFEDDKGTVVLTNGWSRMEDFWQKHYNPEDDFTLDYTETLKFDERLKEYFKEGNNAVIRYNDLDKLPLQELPITRAIMIRLPYEFIPRALQEYFKIEGNSFEGSMLPGMLDGINRAVANLLRRSPDVDIGLAAGELNNFEKMKEELAPYINFVEQ